MFYGTLIFGLAIVAVDALLAGTKEHRTDGHSAAVLVSGIIDRLQVAPLLENIVRANVAAGTRVDIYFTLKAPLETQNFAANKGESKWLVTEEGATSYTRDNRIMEAMLEGAPTAELYPMLCAWAKASGATVCKAEEELHEPVSGVPDDEAHRKVMSYYNPLETTTGANVLRRWRSIEKLWNQAKSVEQKEGFHYTSVLVARDDNYWLAPYLFDNEGFATDPATLKSTSCLEAHGVNDKALSVGRVAADLVLPTYSVFTKIGPGPLTNTRNAEEFLFKLAATNGVGMQPVAFPMALATMTQSGIPCFRKQGYNLTDRGGYQKCYNEADENSPLTKFFRTFNCDKMDPPFYDAVHPEQVQKMHQAVKKAAGGERKPIAFSMVGSANAQALAETLRSLRQVDPSAGAIAVTREDGVCATIGAESLGFVCLEIGEVNTAFPEHALLTTVALSGRTAGVLAVDPGMKFQSSPLAAFLESAIHSDLVVASRPPGEQCESGSSLAYFPDTPGAAHVLLRTWASKVEQRSDTLRTSSAALLPGGVKVGDKVVSQISWAHAGRSLSIGDVGIVRSQSQKDPERVVIDFDSIQGISILPKQFALQGFGSTFAAATNNSPGVRVARRPCDQLGL